MCRRRVYFAVEAINNPFFTNRSNRIGVPQHFGIYYAIGMEGFITPGAVLLTLGLFFTPGFFLLTLHTLLFFTSCCFIITPSRRAVY
jgi:hypothetical protein